jgi:hypothetical protein
MIIFNDSIKSLINVKASDSRCAPDKDNVSCEDADGILGKSKLNAVSALRGQGALAISE